MTARYKAPYAAIEPKMTPKSPGLAHSAITIIITAHKIIAIATISYNSHVFAKFGANLINFAIYSNRMSI